MTFVLLDNDANRTVRITYRLDTACGRMVQSDFISMYFQHLQKRH